MPRKSKTDNAFGVLLSKEREVRNITMEDLSYGLCSRSTIEFIEKGKRYPDKLMRDRLLARMGVHGYDSESYLDATEYDDWRERDKILCLLELHQFEQAQEQLKTYHEKYGNGKIRKQFCYAMQAELLFWNQAPLTKQREVLKKAVAQTVPEITDSFMSERKLSAPEINLILEYLTWQPETQRKPEHLQREYQKILCYIEHQVNEKEEKEPIYAKTILYLCRLQQKHPQLSSVADNLHQCNKGIESLRKAGKGVFLWELLSLRKELLEEDGMADKRQEWYKETTDWLEMIEKLSMKYHVPKETCHYTYLYQEHEVYCFGDVIRIRRIMLSMTQEQLCEGICSLRTMHRIEQKNTKTHRDIVKELFQRLKLSMELHHFSLDECDKEMLTLEREFRKAANDHDFEKAERWYNEIETRISLDSAINQQYLLLRRTDLDFRLKRIDATETEKRILQALEYTIPFEALCKAEEVYLTNEEVHCLHQLSKLRGNKLENPYAKVLLKIYQSLDEAKEINAHIATIHWMGRNYSNNKTEDSYGNAE